LATLLGKEINQEMKMFEDQDKKGGGLTNASNEDNIIYPTIIDQLLERLHKELEEKNAANVADALVGCSNKSHSSKVAEQHKPSGETVDGACEWRSYGRETSSDMLLIPWGKYDAGISDDGIVKRSTISSKGNPHITI
jgi:hypothetical protein